MNIVEVKSTVKTADTGAYSAAVLVNGWLYISGQGPLDLKSGAVISGSIEEETALTLSHIREIVQAAGGTMQNIVKCTVHLSDINDFDRFDKTYAAIFPGIKPARTTVQSVLSDGIKIEIDAVAFIG
ncbi:2-iminobutanoate/2-iminopropanoate deaminase [Chitinophaga ginsengisegetis]|uniref:2-iminobutanoate/2-iminopropanoate deaminase n=1 Tax=Chitinophaga ginsengisegetis TaxID=393003 RepID=A0A1T5PBA0_9BACT|nr:RidA family protein [Chitinophaga ginsengisegetis]SKD10020.1 2-iminobutanoate/2-iminopropanoate deaminase [Chitinophaga ginsengisegetis]